MNTKLGQKIVLWKISARYDEMAIPNSLCPNCDWIKNYGRSGIKRFEHKFSLDETIEIMKLVKREREPARKYTTYNNQSDWLHLHLFCWLKLLFQLLKNVGWKRYPLHCFKYEFYFVLSVLHQVKFYISFKWMSLK